MSRSTTTYTQGSGQRFMDVLIDPHTLKSGALVDRLDVIKYPRLGVVTGVDVDIDLVVTPVDPQDEDVELTLTATVTPSEVDGPLVGGVVFYDGTDELGSALLDEDGVAVVTTLLAAGDHTLTAEYVGGGNYRPETSAGTDRTST